jgi:hypothetical protein
MGRAAAKRPGYGADRAVTIISAVPSYDCPGQRFERGGMMVETPNRESGKIKPAVLLWGLGVPIPIVILILIYSRGC